MIDCICIIRRRQDPKGAELLIGRKARVLCAHPMQHLSNCHECLLVVIFVYVFIFLAEYNACGHSSEWWGCKYWNKHEGNIGCFSPFFCSMKSLRCSLLLLCHFGVSVLSCVHHSSHLHRLCSLLSPKKTLVPGIALFLRISMDSFSPSSLVAGIVLSWLWAQWWNTENAHSKEEKKIHSRKKKKLLSASCEVVRVELSAAVAQNGDVDLCLLRTILKDVCGWHRTKSRFKLLLSEVKLTAWKCYPDSPQIGAVIWYVL